MDWVYEWASSCIKTLFHWEILSWITYISDSLQPLITNKLLGLALNCLLALTWVISWGDAVVMDVLIHAWIYFNSFSFLRQSRSQLIGGCLLGSFKRRRWKELSPAGQISANNTPASSSDHRSPHLHNILDLGEACVLGK